MGQCIQMIGAEEYLGEPLVESVDSKGDLEPGQRGTDTLLEEQLATLEQTPSEEALEHLAVLVSFGPEAQRERSLKGLVKKACGLGIADVEGCVDRARQLTGQFEVGSPESKALLEITRWLASPTELLPQTVVGPIAILDSILREIFLKKVAKKTGLTLGALREAIREAPSSKPSESGVGGFRDVEPASKPVETDAILDDLISFFLKYLILPSVYAAHLLALWVLHSWTFKASPYSPRLAILAPHKRCGKSRVLDLVEMVSFRPLPVQNTSPAALFRAIEAFEPTLLIDEVDTFLRYNEELRGVLNAGVQPNGRILRCVGDNNEPTVFRCFGPVALAGIGTLPDTLMDRSIVIPMRRRMKHESVERFHRRVVDMEAAPLRSMIARWAIDNREVLESTFVALPEGLDDRAADCWEPLFAIARTAGDEWLTRAHEASIELSQRRGVDEGDELETLILRDILTVFSDRGDKAISTTDLVIELNRFPDSPWSEFGRTGRGLTAHALGHLLRPYDIRSDKLSELTGRARGYLFSQFVDVWQRYLGEQVGDVPRETDQDVPF